MDSTLPPFFASRPNVVSRCGHQHGSDSLWQIWMMPNMSPFRCVLHVFDALLTCSSHGFRRFVYNLCMLFACSLHAFYMFLTCCSAYVSHIFHTFSGGTCCFLSFSHVFFKLRWSMTGSRGVCWSVGMVELQPEISWATSKAVPGIWIKRVSHISFI